MLASPESKSCPSRRINSLFKQDVWEKLITTAGANVWLSVRPWNPLAWGGEVSREKGGSPTFLLLLKRDGDGHARGIKCRM